MFVEVSKTHNILVLSLLKLLILLYTFTISFGIVFRIEGDSSLQPLFNLTYLTYFIGFFSLLSAIGSKKIKSDPVINTLFFLTFYLFVNTLLFSNDLLGNMTKLVSFFGNIILVLLISNIRINDTFLIKIFKAISIGAFISSSLTLFDQFFYDIPYFNEMTFRLVGFESRGFSGPFQSRTTMGAFYSIVMPISILSFLQYRRPIFLVSFVLSFIAMMSTFNRGAPFAVIIITIIFVIRKYRINIKTILTAFFISIFMLFVVYNIFSTEQKRAIEFLVLSTLNIVEKSDNLSDSDNVRTDALKQIFTEELVKNPFGHGFNDFYLKGYFEPISVHSNLNYIFYIAGYFGAIWLVIFLIKLYKFTDKIDDENLAIVKYSLFSWTLYSLTHMVLSTFLAWLLLGILLNRYLITKQIDL